MSTATPARQYRRPPNSPAYFIGRPAIFWQRMIPSRPAAATRTEPVATTR